MIERLGGAEGGLERVYAERQQEQDGSILAALERSIQRVIAVCEQTAAARVELDSAIGRAVGSARALSAAAANLGELEAGLRFAGFNATVRAAQIARGTTATQCIAQEIRDQAAVINAAATNLTRRIEALISAARALAEKILPQLEANQQQLQEGVGRCATTLQSLEAAGRGHHAAAVDAARDVPLTLAATAEGFTVETEGCRLMLALATKLEALAAAAGEPNAEATLPELDRLLRERYTTSTERRVHEGRQPQPEPAPEEAEVDLSDVLL